MIINKLKLYRQMNNMTQQELAEKVNVTRQTITSIENYKYTPSLELAFKLSDVLHVDLRELFTLKEG